MDSNSLYYFQELCKDMNMHRTAERVFVSQQTISNHVMRLENELGCKLFERKPTLRLTDAGRQVLLFSDEMVRAQKNLQDKLADIVSEERGRIVFGASMLRLDACLPEIMPVFLRRYPNVELMLKDRMEQELEELVVSGEVDIGVIVAVSDESELIVEPLMDDQVYVCVSDTLLREYYGEKAGEIRMACKDGADLKNLSRLPFCMLDNRLGKEIMLCFDEEGIRPEIAMSSSYMQIAASVGFRGTAAFFSTQVGLASRKTEIPADMNIFPLLKNKGPLYHRIYMIRHKKRYLPAYTRYFTDLLRIYNEETEREHMGRIAAENDSA